MRPRSVIIGGAGLAGLAAARVCAAARLDVTIVDARARPGGRVLTWRSGDAHGELGGELIEEEQDDVLQLARDVGSALEPVLPRGFSHRYTGADGRPHVSRTRPWSELEALVAPLVDEYRAAGGRTDADATRLMAKLSLRELLRLRGATREQHAIADGLRGFFLAEPDELSVLPLVEQVAGSGSPAQTKMFRVAGGNDRLVSAMLDSTDARLLLEHEVVAVHQDDQGVRAVLRTRDGARTQLDADAAVITFPATTLRRVEFTPPLPEQQQRAICALRYGAATKVLVRTAGDPFGGRRTRAWATDGPLGAFWDGGAGVITFLGGGHAAATLLSRAEDPRSLLASLCWLGGGGAVRDHARYSWTDDPWAVGGYAYLDPAFDPAWRPLLGRRAGRITFAGEHTSLRWQGYMNGAVESGLRAAGELLAA